MILTEKKTETEMSLEKPVQKSYFGSLNLDAPDDTPLFEVEREYNNFDKPENKTRNQMLPEFDIIPTNDVKKEEQVQNEPAKDIKLSLRGKILAVVASLVTVLLLTLVIYNGVVLNAKRAEVNELSAELQTSLQELTALENNLIDAQSEEAVFKILKNAGSSLRKATNADTVKFHVEEFEVTKYEAPSNWFDKLCKFLSDLF